jgi:hypothetical protein
MFHAAEQNFRKRPHERDDYDNSINVHKTPACMENGGNESKVKQVEEKMSAPSIPSTHPKSFSMGYTESLPAVGTKINIPFAENAVEQPAPY